MKIILLIFGLYFGLALTETNAQDNLEISPRSGINDQILEAIEKFKKLMPCGISEIGVPILAPFEQTFGEYTYNRKFLQAIASVFDLRVDGLNKFDVNNIKMNVLTLKGSFDLTFTELKAQSDYVANAFLIKFIKISGNGKMNVQMKDLRLVGDFQIGSNSTGLYLKKLKVVVALGGFKSDITGLLWGKLSGKLANRAIQRFVPYMLKNKQENISQMVEDIVLPKANKMMEGLKIGDLLEIMKKIAQLPECKKESQYFFM